MSAERMALDGTPFPGQWREKGACRHVPTSIFFPMKGEDPAPAQAVCGACPVVEECQAYAMEVPGLKGVWAGLTERQRKRLRAIEPDDAEVSRLALVGPTASPAGTLLAHLEELTSHPGRWARVASFASKHSAGALASLLRRSRRPVPAGRWSFEGRRDDAGGSQLWARYETPQHVVSLESMRDMSAEELAPMVEGGAPPTADDVSITTADRRLDSEEAVRDFVAELAAERDAARQTTGGTKHR